MRTMRSRRSFGAARDPAALFHAVQQPAGGNRRHFHQVGQRRLVHFAVIRQVRQRAVLRA
jgi:hypothetical protein